MPPTHVARNHLVSMLIIFSVCSFYLEHMCKLATGWFPVGVSKSLDLPLPWSRPHPDVGYDIAVYKERIG